MPGSGDCGIIFSIGEIGAPFQSVMDASLTTGPGSSELRFSLRLKPLVPAVFTFFMVISVWPGILLVDSMLKKYFSWYTIPTGWWYYPLTIPTTPWAIWSAIKKSKASAAAEAPAIIEKIAKELGARSGASTGTGV